MCVVCGEFVHARIYVCVNLYMCESVYVCMRACVHACVCVGVCMCAMSACHCVTWVRVYLLSRVFASSHQTRLSHAIQFKGAGAIS